MEYNVLNQEMQHHKSTEQSISKPVHHEQTASDQPSIDNLFQGEEYEVGVKSQLNNSEGENVSPFFEVGLGHNQTIVENNKPDFNDDVPDIKSEPDLNDNVQDLPKFDKIIEYNGNAKVHQNMLDNVFGTFDPTYTFCDLSDVLDVVDQDQTSATCCVGVSRDACVDNMLPAFDKIKGDSEITCSHLKDNTALDNNPPSVINDPVSLDESIEESGEEDSLINGYITCIEDNNVLGSDALDTYSVNNYCGFELVMDDLKSEGTVHKDEIEYVDSELEKETMAESPLPDCKLLQDHDSGETKINVANCNNLSVIPSNVLENESLTIERNRANNNVIHEEKQSKTSNFGWGVTNTVILCDDTDIEKVVDNNSEHTVEMEDETDELCVESRSELCSLRTGNLHVGKDSADGICSTESGAELCSQRAKQDTCMSDTDIVTDDTTEYLTEKESCFVVLGTLLVIMCIELYSSSNKHIGAVTAVETDLLESTDDLGLNLLFKDEAGGKHNIKLGSYICGYFVCDIS